MKTKLVNTMSISAEFPDRDYIPFTEASHAYNEITKYTVHDFKDLIGADFWGFYIRDNDGRVVPIYNTYPYSDDLSKMPQWLDNVRSSLYDCETNTLPEIQVGETVAVLMFAEKGWAIYATKTSDGWEYKYCHHKDY